MSVTVNYDGGTNTVTITSGSFRARIKFITGAAAGLYADHVEYNTGSWTDVLTGGYTFLKFTSEDGTTQANLWPNDAALNTSDGGSWSGLSYGTRTVGGVQEGYATATWTMADVQDTGSNPMNLDVTMVTEFYIRDGETMCRRVDSVTTTEMVDNVEIQQYAEAAGSEARRGYIKKHINDCEASTGWTKPGTVSISTTTDRWVGSNALSFSVASSLSGQSMYQSVSSEDWSGNKYFAFWIKPGTNSVPNALKFYIKNNGGAKQYLGHPVSMYYDYILNGTATAHNLQGRWRLVVFDLSLVTCNDVEEWGMEINTNTAFDFKLDDVWRFGWSDISTSAGLDQVYFSTPLPPANFFDEAAFPSETNKVDYNKFSYLPYLTHYQATTLGGSIFSKSRNGVYFIAKTDGSSAWLAGTRANSIPTAIDRMNYRVDTAYAVAPGASKDATTTALKTIFDTFSTTATGKTAEDLPTINPVRAFVQNGPGDRYRWSAYLEKALNHELVNSGGAVLMPACSNVTVFYRDQDSYAKGASWENVMVDDKRDIIALGEAYHDISGQPFIVESTVAVPEGYCEVPHYFRDHLAVLEDGSNFHNMLWIYESSEGYRIVRETAWGSTPAGYYNDITEDGRTYELVDTYPISGINLVSAYGTTAELGYKTYGERRLEQLTYICDNYDVDCIALSEDTTYYQNGSYSTKDFESYNYWRQNVRSPALAAAGDWPRISGDVDVDDTEIWSWKNWLLKRWLDQAVETCHERGVMVMLDINIDSTVYTRNIGNSKYSANAGLKKQDGSSNWFTRDFNNYSRRYGTDIREVIKSADLLYVWMYGEFSPWGFSQNTLDYLNWLQDKWYHGRIVLGFGLYPDSAPPEYSELQQASLYGVFSGYNIAFVGTKDFYQLVDPPEVSTTYPNIYWDVIQGSLALASNRAPVYSSGSITVPALPVGIYFNGAVAGVTVHAPGDVKLKHYNKDHELVKVYDPYLASPIDVSVGDSMVLVTSTRRAGKAVTFLEIEAPMCALTYGTSPCTASGGPGEECYNTRATCQDTANYTETDTKIIRFVDTPAGLPPGITALPYLRDVAITPPKLNLTGVASRASMTASIENFAHHDRGIDPYVDTRDYDPETQGTFWPRLKARHKYGLPGAKINVKTGVISSPFDWDDFEHRQYINEKMEWGGQQMKITAKDPIKQLDDKRAKAIDANKGALSATLTSGSTSAFSVTGDTAYATGGGLICIGSELIRYTSGTVGSNTFTFGGTITRAQYGTEAEEHEAGEKAQLCLEWVEEPISDAIYGLFTRKIDATYINKDAWDEEFDTWAPGATVSGVLRDPGESILDVTNNICEFARIMIWHDELRRTIKLKLLSPSLSAPKTLTDERHLIDPTTVQDDDKERVSSLIVYHSPRSQTGDMSGQDNFQSINVTIDLENYYADERVKVFYARFAGPSEAVLVSEFASRITEALRDTPQRIKFRIDAKDKGSINIGDNIMLDTDVLQSADGSNNITRFIVLSIVEREAGHLLEIEAIDTNLAANFGLWADSLPDYDDATDEQRGQFGWWNDPGDADEFESTKWY